MIASGHPSRLSEDQWKNLEFVSAYMGKVPSALQRNKDPYLVG